jgi:hypothetical protein
MHPRKGRPSSPLRGPGAKNDRRHFVPLCRCYVGPVRRFCHAALGTCRDGVGFAGWFFRIARNVVNDDDRTSRKFLRMRWIRLTRN